MNTIQMKIIVVLLFCMVNASSFGQTRLAPLYYLNSEEIDLENVFIKTSNIDDVKVDKTHERGAVYITIKKPLTFLTLDMILRNNSENSDSTRQVVYMINGKVTTDKSKVKVDASYFIQVEIKRLDKLTYIDEVHRSLILVDIQLLNEKPKPEIRIRGDEGLQTRN